MITPIKLLGATMVALPFILAFAAMWYLAGWRVACTVFVLAVIIAGLIIAGCHLLNS